MTDLVFAAPASTPGEAAVIVGIEVDGLKRTKSAVVERILAKYVGTTADELDFDTIRSILLGTELFENIDIFIREDVDRGRILVITLDEKWSIIPAPLFAADSDGWIGGFGFLDANAFGLADHALAVGLIRPSGWSALFRYSSQPPDDQSFGWKASASLSDGSLKIVDDEDTVLADYDAFALDATVEVERSFGPVFSAISRIAFRELAVRDDAPAAGRVLPISFGFSAQELKWDGVFLSEKKIQAVITHSFALIGESFAGVEAQAVYERSLFPGFRVVLHAGGFFAPDTPEAFAIDPSEADIDLLPTDFRTPSLLCGSLGFESRLLSLPLGVISALASFQLAFADGYGAETVAYGPSFAFRLYLAKIAVPAVDIGTAYNAATGTWRAAIGIGLQL